MVQTNLQKKGSKLARPLRITFPGAFYQVPSGGKERKAVFKSKRGKSVPYSLMARPLKVLPHRPIFIFFLGYIVIFNISRSIWMMEFFVSGTQSASKSCMSPRAKSSHWTTELSTNNIMWYNISLAIIYSKQGNFLYKPEKADTI